MTHSDLIRLCHARAKRRGWWYNRRNMGECIALIHSEIVEANKGWRTRLKDHHLPQYWNWEVELADVYIRVADLLGWLGQTEKPPKFLTPAFPKIYCWNDYTQMLHEFSSEALEGFRKNNLRKVTENLWKLLLTISYISGDGGEYSFPLIKAINAKLDYNDQRADHKLENRMKAGGKKF